MHLNIDKGYVTCKQLKLQIVTRYVCPLIQLSMYSTFLVSVCLIVSEFNCSFVCVNIFLASIIYRRLMCYWIQREEKLKTILLPPLLAAVLSLDVRWVHINTHIKTHLQFCICIYAHTHSQTYPRTHTRLYIIVQIFT